MAHTVSTVMNIMSIVDDNIDKTSDADYLNMCNLLKKVYTKVKCIENSRAKWDAWEANNTWKRMSKIRKLKVLREHLKLDKNDTRDIKELEQLYNEKPAIVTEEGQMFRSDGSDDLTIRRFYDDVEDLYVVPFHLEFFYVMKMECHNEEVMSRAREERAKLLDRF